MAISRNLRKCVSSGGAAAAVVLLLPGIGKALPQAVGAPAASAPPTPPEKSLYQQALDLIDKDKFKEAFAALNEVLKRDPDNLDALKWRGITYAHLRQYKEAVRELTAYLRKRPGDEQALHAIASAKSTDAPLPKPTVPFRLQPTPEEIATEADPVRLQVMAAQVFAQKRYPEALGAYTRILALRPDDTEALYNRAVCFGLMERYSDAIVDLTRYLTVKPDDAAAYNMRAIARGKTGKWEDAAADFSQVLRLRPNDLDALKNRGISYYNARRYSDAQRDAEAYLEKQPNDSVTDRILHSLRYQEPSYQTPKYYLKDPPDNDPDALYNLGVWLMTQKRYAEAAKAFTRVLAVRPKDKDALQNRAVAYYQRGRSGDASAFEKAEADTTTLLASNPKNSDALLLRADARFSVKKYIGAAGDYEAYLAEKSSADKKYASDQWVASAFNAKDFALVIRAATKALAFVPDAVQNLNYRGLAYLQLKQFADAATDLKAYLAVKQEDTTAWYNLGAAYYGQQDWKAAAQTFREAFQRKPDYYAAASQAGQAEKKIADLLLAQGDKRGASAAYDRAVAMYEAAATGLTLTAKEDALWNAAIAREASAKAAETTEGRTEAFRGAVTLWERYLTSTGRDDEDAKRTRAHIEELRSYMK
jgi:tetratricopeptide (TPR) repeat protein